jgi:hypothetical protein
MMKLDGTLAHLGLSAVELSKLSFNLVVRQLGRHLSIANDGRRHNAARQSGFAKRFLGKENRPVKNVRDEASFLLRHTSTHPHATPHTQRNTRPLLSRSATCHPHKHAVARVGRRHQGLRRRPRRVPRSDADVRRRKTLESLAPYWANV